VIEERDYPAASYLAHLPSPSQTRIRAGMLKTHARWLNTPVVEWRTCLQEAFDVIADELIKSASTATALPIIPRLVSDEAIRNGWIRWFRGMPEPDALHTELFGCYWVDPDKLRLVQWAVEGRAVAWRAEYLLRFGESVPTAELSTRAEIKKSRATLLADYMLRTGVRTKAAIYRARNPGVHKPQLYEWLNGVLPSTSSTARNLEAFLGSDALPVPRVLKD